MFTNAFLAHWECPVSACLINKNRNVPQLSSPSLWLCLKAVTVFMRASSIRPVTSFKQWCKHHLELTIGDKPTTNRVQPSLLELSRCEEEDCKSIFNKPPFGQKDATRRLLFLFLVINCHELSRARLCRFARKELNHEL